MHFRSTWMQIAQTQILERKKKKLKHKPIKLLRKSQVYSCFKNHILQFVPIYFSITCNSYIKFIPGNETIASLDIANLTLPTYNLTETESGDYELNITTLTPEKTLAGSKLLEIDVNKTSKTEIRKEFCREIKAISLKYSEPQVR